MPIDAGVGLLWRCCHPGSCSAALESVQPVKVVTDETFTKTSNRTEIANPRQRWEKF
jgi:hypothetical protein